MTTKTTERNLVKEVEELLATHSIVAMRVDKPYKEIKPLLRRLVEEVKQRDDLIGHMWVYSGYHNNGYLQMTTEQKVLYDAIIQRERGINA